MRMEYQEAIDYVVQHPEVIMKKAKKSGYVCPCCGSGSGHNGTGITESKKYKNLYTCFAGGCFSGANVFGIVAVKENLGPKEAFFRTLDIYGIELSNSNQHKNSNELRKDFTGVTKKSLPGQEVPTIPLSVILDDIGRSQQENDSTNYLLRRGLSEETQKHFGCGFISKWYTPSVRERVAKGGLKIHATPRVIIPTSGHSYLARDIRPKDQLNDYEKGYTKMKVGSQHQFNWQILKKAKGFVLITEGEIDAMSIYESGHKQVLGIGSTAYVNSFLDYVKGHAPAKEKIAFGIIMDADKPGRAANDKLLAGLREMGYAAVDAAAVLLPGTKDANESLMADPAAFKANLVKKTKETMKEHKKETAICR